MKQPFALFDRNLLQDMNGYIQLLQNSSYVTVWQEFVAFEIFYVFLIKSLLEQILMLFTDGLQMKDH